MQHGSNDKVNSDDAEGTRNQKQDWHDIVGLEQTWFDYLPEHELISFPPDGKAANREPVTVQSKTGVRSGSQLLLPSTVGVNSTRPFCE
jgi:hypothetical protein